MTRCRGISVVLAIADISRIAHAHLPSTTTVTDPPPTPKPPSSVSVVIPPVDLFALLRLRSTGGELLCDFRPVSYDAVQHRSGQPAWRACRPGHAKPLEGVIRISRKFWTRVCLPSRCHLSGGRSGIPGDRADR